MSIDIPDCTMDEWLAELKPYQRSSVAQLLQSNEPNEAAKIWLTSHGALTTIPFGGVKDTQPFWDNFLAEFNKFVCDDDEYKADKKDFAKEAPVSKALLISVVSAAIGARLGFSATFVAPAVVLSLYAVGKLTKNAYCATYYKKHL